MEEIILNCIQKHFPLCNIGRKRSDHRIILQAIFHVLRTGCQWRSVQHVPMSYKTIHRHFMQWSSCGIFKEAYTIAFRLQRKPVRRKLRFQCIDTTFVKNIYGQDCLGRNPTDRGRRATKLSALVDQDGLPLSLVFFPANVNDVRTVEPTIRQKITKNSKPKEPKEPLYADKGYDSKSIRIFLQNEHYIDRIGQRRKVVHRLVNRRRNVVERFFAWLDKSRRLLLRFDSKITSYDSFTWLACIRLLEKKIVW